MTGVLPWFERASTLPMMPGGLDDQLPNLRSLLDLIKANDGSLDALVRWPDPAASPVALRECVQRLGRSGLIERRSRAQISLTEDGEAWRSSGDPLELMVVFHNHMQFFGELVNEVTSSDAPPTHEDMRIIARDTYGLPWTSLDPGRRRTTWLRAAGLIELRFDNTLAGTEKSETFLQKVDLTDPASLLMQVNPDDSEVDVQAATETSANILRLLSKVETSQIGERRNSTGQIPSPPGTTVIETLKILTEAVQAGATREQLFSVIIERLGVVEGSAPRVASMLVSNGLIRQTSATTYEITTEARAWLESGNNLDLIRILHVRVQLVGELLDAVELHDKAPALSKYASAAYKFRPDVNGVRTRLHLLLHAGLLYESGWGKYSLTNLGRVFRETLPRLAPKLLDDDLAVDSQPSSDIETGEARTELSLADSIAEALTRQATMTEKPQEFEVAVRDAFRYLGFEAEHLGGSGKTDVLLTYRSGPGEYTVISVDTKASASGIVEERAIDFDTILEHKKHHNASHACIIGASFHQSRLPNRAKERGVALLEVALLVEAVRRQEAAALGTQQLAEIFNSRNSPRDSLNAAWKRADRRNSLFGQVIATLAREAQEDDEVAHGALTLDNLYFLLRSDSEAKPDLAIIEQAVDLLSSPLVDSVSRAGKGQFVAKEQPATIARKLRALALAAQIAADASDES